MKKILSALAITVFLFCGISLAQDVPKGVYVFNHFAPLAACDVLGEPILEDSVRMTRVIETGTRFRVVLMTQNRTSYIIKLLKFSDQERQMNLNETDGEGVFYIISLARFLALSEIFKPNWDFSGGIVTTPLKFRLAKNDSIKLPNGNSFPRRAFDLVTNFNLGASIGIKRRFGQFGNASKNSVSLLFGASVVAINADSSTTNGFYTDSKTELFGAALSSSLVFEYNNFQGVFSVGLDMLGGNIGENWMYQKAPWIGIGIGTSLFEANLSGNVQP